MNTLILLSAILIMNTISISVKVCELNKIKELQMGKNNTKNDILRDRKAGMSLRKIAEKYKDHGVTMHMVRKVCSNVVKPPSGVELAIEGILPLSTRSIGVKPSEYYSIMKNSFGIVWCEKEGRMMVDCTQQQSNYIRRRVRELAEKSGMTALFVPEWMDRSAPRASNQEMLVCAEALFNYLEEQVNNYLRCFPEMEGAGYSVRSEILSLAVRGYDKGGVIARCARNTDAVLGLESGNLIEVKKEYQSEDIGDYEEDVLSVGF